MIAVVASLLLACAPALPQLPAARGGETFVVAPVPVAEGAPPRHVVAADQRAIDCLEALRRLSAAMNWNLSVESTPLENDLRFATVDLNLVDQDPRIIAQLIAVAAGADCVFHDPLPVDGARTTMHVVRVPSGETESGRQRLRAMAGQWYRSFLRDELRNEPLVQREGVQVRLRLGQLLLDSGDLGAAIVHFTEVYEQRPNDHVAAAILAVAGCHLDLAKGHVDAERRMAEFQSAEQWARRLLERMPSAPEVAPATILLGRALLGQAQAEPRRDLALQKARLCQDELRARIIRLLDSVEMLEVWLLAAQAQFLLEQPERVYETMLSLRESAWFAHLGKQQLLDYHFLLGYGALGKGEHDLAMRSLEWFLVNGENDARRGRTFVLLAESYLALQRFVQARAASTEARQKHLGSMTPDWRERTLRVWAKSALALGEKEAAFVELEQMVLRGEEPELSLFLADEMLADRQWQRAIAVVRPMLDAENAAGDRARFKTVQALFEQGAASRHLDDFPAQAIQIAPRILDPVLRSKVATLIGDAYTRLGKLEHAADAYRGILR
jgi:tetratricopeptide (TPR) repeat protein